MNPQNTFLTFGTAENLSLIAIVLSAIFSILTLVLNRRELPNIMPDGQKVTLHHFELFFLNTSDFNIRNLSILINGFGSKDLSEIKPLYIIDKYLFVIGEKSKFSYGFNLGDWAKKGFYFRVRFCGKYATRYFLTRSFEQEIWYTFSLEMTSTGETLLLIHSTHKDDIERLIAQNEKTLKSYEKIADKKFKN